jgi:ATP-dependent DNA ligase
MDKQSNLSLFLDHLKNYDPYPVLYSRTSTGAIQTWKVEVDGNKYRFVTGQKNSQNIVYSEWTICNGKNIGRSNETSPQEQAHKEAKAAQEKKLKSGGYWQNEDDIDKIKFVEPMLAYSLKNKTQDHTGDVEYPCMVDRKYNGNRIISTRTGCWTRKGNKYISIPHIEESLKPLFDKFPQLVLDGEGYQHELRFRLNEITSIMRTTKSITSDFLKKSKESVKYYIYDGYNFTTPDGNQITEDTPCVERRKALNNLLKNVQYTVVVPYKIANSLNEIYKIYEEYVEDGYEGAIIRNFKAPYQHKRTSDLLKVKPLDDAEFKIIDIEDPMSGNWGGTGKIVWFIDNNGNKFKGTAKGSFEQCKQFLKEKSNWINKKVTVYYNGLTAYGVPNYARLDMNNCLKGDR